MFQTAIRPAVRGTWSRFQLLANNQAFAWILFSVHFGGLLNTLLSRRYGYACIYRVWMKGDPSQDADQPPSFTLMKGLLLGPAERIFRTIGSGSYHRCGSAVVEQLNQPRRANMDTIEP